MAGTGAFEPESCWCTGRGGTDNAVFLKSGGLVK